MWAGQNIKRRATDTVPPHHEIGHFCVTMTHALVAASDARKSPGRGDAVLGRGTRNSRPAPAEKARRQERGRACQRLCDRDFARQNIEFQTHVAVFNGVTTPGIPVPDVAALQF